MKKTLVLTLIFLAAPSLAQQSYPQDFHLCWNNPSQYVDGAAIEAGDLTEIRIELFRQNDTVPVFVANFPDNGEGLEQCETILGAVPQPGTYTAVGYAIVFDGTESDPSAPGPAVKYIGKPNSIDITYTGKQARP